MQLPVILRGMAREKEDLTSPTVSGVLMGRVGSLKTGFISSAFSEGIVKEKGVGEEMRQKLYMVGSIRNVCDIHYLIKK